MSIIQGKSLSVAFREFCRAHGVSGCATFVAHNAAKQGAPDVELWGTIAFLKETMADDLCFTCALNAQEMLLAVMHKGIKERNFECSDVAA